MKHRTHRGVLALATLLVITTMVGGGPSALMGAVLAEPPTPAAGMVTLEGPMLSSLFPTFWAISDNNTSGASLAVDAAGGVHAAMSGYTAVPGNIYPVYYGYCAENCADAASWGWTIAGQVGMGASDCDGVRLALDPQGRPRLMWYFLASPIGDDPGYYEYAECDANCLDNASWKVVDAITVNPVAFPWRGRYFALDPQGRPRFVYREVNAWEGRTGTYYRYCDANCADETDGTWHEYRLNEEFLSDTSLAFTSSGLARLAYRTGDYLAYYENLDGANSWSGGFFFDLGSGASFALRVDSQDRPRLAIYNGYRDGGPDDDRLSYAWCQTGCDVVENWNVHDLGLPEDYGKDVDLVLDAQDRPHLAYNVDYIGSPSVAGLGYARCSDGCETDAPSWQAGMIETSDALDAAEPIPPTTQGCYSFWLDVGERPSLAIDAAGNVRIGYNCVHYQGGGACSRVDDDIHRVRLAAMDTDDGGGDDGGGDDGGNTPPPDQTEKLYVPMIRTR